MNCVSHLTCRHASLHEGSAEAAVVAAAEPVVPISPSSRREEFEATSNGNNRILLIVLCIDIYCSLIA